MTPNEVLDEAFGGEDGVSPIRFHHRQHGGWAAAAKRRGESYLFCVECGSRHPRTFQAAPIRRGLTWPEVLGLFAQIIAAIVVGSVAFAFLFGMAVGS
jgi:hypothetical protein